MTDGVCLLEVNLGALGLARGERGGQGEAREKEGGGSGGKHGEER